MDEEVILDAVKVCRVNLEVGGVKCNYFHELVNPEMGFGQQDARELFKLLGCMVAIPRTPSPGVTPASTPDIDDVIVVGATGLLLTDTQSIDDTPAKEPNFKKPLHPAPRRSRRNVPK